MSNVSSCGGFVYKTKKKTSVQEGLRNSSKWIIANSFIFLRIAILLIKKTY